MYSPGHKTYASVGAYAGFEDATPEQVVQRMLETLLARIAEARGNIERGDVQAKSEKISKALGIVEGLVMSLDMERGGDIAANLERLYDYVSSLLLRANLENRTELLVEAGSLVGEIKQGWDSLVVAG
jgi:flagellar protein FliS